MKKIFLSRYGLLLSTIIIYIITSFLIRLTLSIISFHNLDGHVYNILCTFAIGLCYDITVALFITTFYNVYLLLFPTCFIGSIADRILTFFILIVTLFITYFGSVAEFPFWDEFGSRFNFIAVDYLIYTYEVIENIKESYPLPLLIGGLLLLVAFSSAHFMFREYNETNFWLGISGYPIAAMTGIYRIFNDKHWVGDVIAGAGIGILSTEVAYWLFPTISKWFANKKNQASLVILPTYQTKQFGLAIIKTF